MSICSCGGQHSAQDSSSVIPPDGPPTEFVSEDAYEGQLANWVRCTTEDMYGNLWFGTIHFGIIRYNGESLDYFNEKHGVGSGRINGIVEDKDGNMWFATWGGLTKYDGKEFRNYAGDDGLPDKDIWSIMIDQNGLIWLGTSGGVFTYDGVIFNKFEYPKAIVETPTSILSPDRVTSIMEDSRGNIWICTDGFGVTMYDPSETGAEAFSIYSFANGLCDNNAVGLLEDNVGNIWIGSMYGGVSRFDGNEFKNFMRDGIINGNEAYGFYLRKNGDVWFAAENQGVYKYHMGEFTKYDQYDGLATNGVHTIYEDSKGRFWFSGWMGLWKFDGNTFTTVTVDGPWD